MFAIKIWWRLDLQTKARVPDFAADSAGIIAASSKEITEITTSSSINVNALFLLSVIIGANCFLVTPLFNLEPL